MANHKSSLKRIRQEETRRLHNRYYGKTMRNAVRKLRATTDKAAATAMYPGITKLLDKLAKTNVIHKNKANNLTPPLPFRAFTSFRFCNRSFGREKSQLF